MNNWCEQCSSNVEALTHVWYSYSWRVVGENPEVTHEQDVCDSCVNDLQRMMRSEFLSTLAW